MKRKISTLLVAFMAVAAFQVNAQNPYDGQTPHWLNIWKSNATNSNYLDATATPANTAEWAIDYPVSADPAITNTASPMLSVQTATSNQSMIAVGNVFTRQEQVGQLGRQMQDYFTLQQVGAGYAYKIVSKAGAVLQMSNVNGDGSKFTDQWEFVRFIDPAGKEYSNAPGYTINSAVFANGAGEIPYSAQAVTPQTGGYLSAPTASAPNDRGRYLVCYDSTLNAQSLPNNSYILVSVDSIRKNWAAAKKAPGKVKFLVPIWVKADPIGGRWANTQDFAQFDFMKFKITGSSNYITVDNTSVFTVGLAGALDFGLNGSDQTVTTIAASHTNNQGNNLAITAAAGTTKRLTYYDNTVTTSPFYAYNTLLGNNVGWKLMYFNIQDPKTGKFLSVKKGNSLTEGLIGNSNSVYGDSLCMTTSRSATYDYRTQQFGIWINDEGDMELYPMDGYTYDFSHYQFTGNMNGQTSSITSGYNFAVWNDMPLVRSGLTNCANEGFKVTFAPNGSYALGATDLTGTTIFKKLSFAPEDANMINLIKPGKWFFLEGRRKAVGSFIAATERVVLDVVTDSIVNGVSYKRVVFTPIEKDRFAYSTPATNPANRYFENPYDSVNMSAHWKIVEVFNTDYPTANNNRAKKLIGYRIVNEEGDTLQYDPNSGAVALQNGTLSRDTAVTSPRTDVWQTVHVSSDSLQYFMLRSDRGAVSNATNPYAPTWKAYVDTAAVTSLWYRGGRAISTSLNQWEKRVIANVGSLGGFELKITNIDYEYAPGGIDNSKTNHSNDGYYPADDSLCTYLYKEGNYDIIEGIAHQLRVAITTSIDDKVHGQSIAWMNNFTETDPILYTEPLTSEAQLAIPQVVSYGGASYNNVDYMTDIYKWHYIKDMSGNYLTYDTINTNTPTVSQQYGFKFKGKERLNATAFRFYQPLVGDKSKENFIIEFRVPQHYYVVDRGNVLPNGQPTVTIVASPNGNRGFANDNYGVSPRLAGQTAASVWGLPTGNAQLGITDPLTVALPAGYVRPVGNNAQTNLPNATVAPWYAIEYAARTKYAIIETSSGSLYSTWSVNLASRFKFRGPDEVGCSRDYVDTEYLLRNGMYYLPVTSERYDVLGKKTIGQYISNNATETTTKTGLRFVLADTIKFNGTTGQGYLQSYAASTITASTPNGLYKAYNNTRNVEVYYVVNESNQYLTVDSSCVFAQDFQQTNADVSGMRLTFKKAYVAPSNLATTFDSRPLQMFAIYGCKSESAPYGTFIYVPVVSPKYDYLDQKVVGTVANVNIGNYAVADEFRIGTWSDYRNTNQLIVLPASGATSTSIPASEYMFGRDNYFSGDFCHHNFIQSVVSGKTNYVSSDSAAATVKSYFNPTKHWLISKKIVNGVADPYKYVFTTEALVDDNGTPHQRTQLLGDFYLILKSTTTGSVAGQTIQTFDVINTATYKNVQTLVITCITETTGDACIDHYYRFTDEMLASYDWAVVESIYKDRFVWSRGAVEGYKTATNPATPSWVITPWNDAYADTIRAAYPAKFLVITKSTTDSLAEHHSMPYYNIIQYDAAKNIRYYMELKNGKAIFREISEREKVLVENYDIYPDSVPSLKFCFPLQGKTTPSQGKVYDQVWIKSRATAAANAYYLQIDGTSGNLSGIRANDPDLDLSRISTWLFGDQSNSGDEWVRLQAVPTNATGWLSNLSQTGVNADNLLTASNNGTPNYAVSLYKSAISKIDTAKFTFEFVDSTTVGKYAPTPIWYYKIKNSAGQYLTAATGKTPEATYYWSNEPYAYFDTKLGSDANFVQTFGFKKVSATSYNFWVVAQVKLDPTSHASILPYQYLAENNSRMVFRNGGGLNKVATENSAMVFQYGQVKNNAFVDVKVIDANAVSVYGVEGAVQVNNATGVVELYTIDGRLIKSVNATASAQTITAPRGVVIVKANGEVTKVIVK